MVQDGADGMKHNKETHAGGITRRGFGAVVGAGVLSQAAERPKPNILWITCEDIGPELGAYGDAYAQTPNLDRLAARGLRYTNAWSTAPVCAPARTAIISGMYPPSTGSEHMRSMTRLPAHMRMYPQFLREAGYYATNNSKEDYNLEKVGEVWDDSSGKGHWRNRKPGQPFFSIFNFTTTHESQIRRRPHTLKHDPAKVRVPAYHPDTPEVRHDWAQYYDNITTMDQQAAGVLRELTEDGLAENTVVLFYGDHGSGMPRSKRWPYNSGLHVPLMAYFPEKLRHLAPPEYRPGGTSERLVGFVDLAPTLLSLAGIKPPSWMQGHAFLGEHRAPDPPYVFGCRGRMDERYDMVRSVRDKRYVYIRNYMPHKIYGQHIAYMFETPTTRVWKKLYDAGRLKQPQTRFWETKPSEELYDLQNDRDEVNNLAESPQHAQTLARLRKALREHVLEVRDVGFLPEDEIHSRSRGSTPYEMGRDTKRYPLEKILAMADKASMVKDASTKDLENGLRDADSAVRYWAAMGLLMRGAPAVSKTKPALQAALGDSQASVRVISAEALGRYGDEADLEKALPVLLDAARIDKHGLYVSMLALNALDALDGKAAKVRDQIRALPAATPDIDARLKEYVGNLIKKTLADLGA